MNNPKPRSFRKAARLIPVFIIAGFLCYAIFSMVGLAEASSNAEEVAAVRPGENQQPFDEDGRNQPPKIEALSMPEGLVAIGEKVEVSVRFSDPDGRQLHRAKIEWGDGRSSSVDIGYTHHFTDVFIYREGGIYTIIVTVIDDDGAADTKRADPIEVVDPALVNLPPRIVDVRGPTYPVAIGEEIAVGVVFYDPNEKDEHRALFEWSDGTTHTQNDPGPVCEEPPPTPGPTCEFPFYLEVMTDAITVDGLDSLTVDVTVTDSAGESAAAEYGPIEVYDPHSGNIKSRGWTRSRQSSHSSDYGQWGGLIFHQLDARWNETRTDVVGQFRFRHSRGRFNFQSTTIDDLFLNHGQNTARLTGEGTINGKAAPNGGPYQFLVEAVDGRRDQMRFKIWYETARGGEKTIYDDAKPRRIRGVLIISED